jgi:fructose-bisphosphate aldolase, class II
MTAAATLDLVREAFAARYAVPAFNVFDDFSLRGVLRAAEAMRSPVIVQASVKTVGELGASYLRALFLERASAVRIPAALHLDHCPDRAVATEALQAGFDSLLFDASGRSFEEALAETREVVAEARRHGAAVESEIEGIKGVEDGVGSEEEGLRYPIAQLASFIAESGVDLFAPAIGTAHGRYSAAPRLAPERISALAAATGIPQVLHGGTGLTAADFRDLVARGCAKVNVSTAIKEAYLKAGLSHLQRAHQEKRWDPPRFFGDAEAAVAEAAREHILAFGSAGRAD